MGSKGRFNLRNDCMILSNDGIKKALGNGALEISPRPDETQYTTSAVDLHLGEEFNVWDEGKLNVKGFKGQLDLSEQSFNETAKAFWCPLRKRMTVRSSSRRIRNILGICSRLRGSAST